MSQVRSAPSNNKPVTPRDKPQPSAMQSKWNNKERAHHFIGTCNNPVGDPKEVLADICADVNADYCIGQLEKGDSGTPHLQLYLYFKKVQRVSTLINKRKGVHFEIAHSWRAVQKYCQKSQSRIAGPWDFGKRPNYKIAEGMEKGKSKEEKKQEKLDEWKMMDTQGAAGFIKQTNQKVASVYVYSQLKKTQLIRKQELMKPYTHHSLRGIWVWGESGSGKDYFIREILKQKGCQIYEKDRTKWFTHYNGERVIYQANAERQDVKYLGHIWKRLAEQNPVKLEYKQMGVLVEAQHEYFIVSSIYELAYNVFEDMIPEKQFRQLERRFQVIYIDDFAKLHPQITHWKNLPKLPDADIQFKSMAPSIQSQPTTTSNPNDLTLPIPLNPDQDSSDSQGEELMRQMKKRKFIQQIQIQQNSDERMEREQEEDFAEYMDKMDQEENYMEEF